MKYQIEEKQVSGPWIVKAAADSLEHAQRIYNLLRFDDMFTTWRVVECNMVIAPQHAHGLREERTVIEFP